MRVWAHARPISEAVGDDGGVTSDRYYLAYPMPGDGSPNTPSMTLDIMFEVPYADYESFMSANAMLSGNRAGSPLGFVTSAIEIHQTVLDDLLLLARERNLALGRLQAIPVARRAIASVVGFASSVSMYQDHAEAAAVRLGGEKFKTKVHAVFARHYDEHPDLFFLRKLRDHAVHSTIDFINITFGANQDSRGQPAWHAGVFLLPDKLSTVPRFNQRLREHITTRNGGNPVPAVEMMQTATDALAALDNEVTLLCYPGLASNATTVLDFYRRCIPKVLNMPAALFFIRADQQGTPRHGPDAMSPLLMEDFEHAARIVNRAETPHP